MQTQTATPRFWKDLAGTYESGAGSCFILHGNVRDHVQPGVYLPAYLKSALANREVVAFYNRANGFSFPMPSMEKKARLIWGLDAAPAAPQGNNALAALMGAAAPQDAGPAPLPTDPASAFPLIEKLLRGRTSAAVIVDYAETIMPQADLSFMAPGDRALLAQMLEWARPDAQPDNPLILIAGSLISLHSGLRAATSGYKAIEIGLPARDARQTFVEWYIAQTQVVFDDITPAELANQTAGLTLVHVENLLLEARKAGSLSRDMARSIKDAMIRQEYAGLVEIMVSDFGFEAVGGMERLKRWAADEIIDPVREGRRGDVSKGVIMAGPPGTGKTFFINALAAEIGFNAVALSMDKILGGIVGESEKRMAQVLQLVKSVTPVLVFMDELDQSDVAQRGNDSGNPVAANLFNQLLRFLGEPQNRGEVIFFGATNRPDLLDSALTRNERVDAIIPVLLPNHEERQAIIEAQARRQGITLAAEAAGDTAPLTVDYSGADLAALVRKAGKLARRAGSDTVCSGHLAAAVQALRPNTLKTARYYTLLALQAVNDTDLLPEEYAELRSDEAALTAALAEAAEQAAPAPRKGGRSL